jgi:hypothetical protein
MLFFYTHSWYRYNVFEVAIVEVYLVVPMLYYTAIFCHGIQKVCIMIYNGRKPIVYRKQSLTALVCSVFAAQRQRHREVLA